jgi:hypothetical protein
MPHERRDFVVLRANKVVNAETELLEMIGTLCSSCGFTRGLNGGQKQSDQNANDRYHYQKFNKCKTK